MPTRNRTSGSRVPSSGLAVVTGSNASVSGTFQEPKYGYTRTGVYPLSARYSSFTDNRASITDETGSPGAIHNCTNSKQVVQPVNTPVATFVQKNPQSPFGSCTTTLNGSVAPYYLDQLAASPHVGVPDGASVALARVPSTSKEVLSGLNSLYELKDCKELLELIPVHFLWAVARRKRAESVRALDRYLRHLRGVVRSPLGLLQAVAGADLMWKFGIKPLVSDINAVHNALSAIDAKLKELANRKFPIAGMYTATKSEGWDHLNGVNNNTMGLFSELCSTTRTTTKTWVFGAIKRLNMSKLPSIDVARQRTLAEQLGLTLDATDLWAAVPYSFVVDWFLPISTFLEQFGRATPDPSWILTDGAWSSVKTVTNGVTKTVITPLTNANCVVQSSSGLNQVIPWSYSEYMRTRLTSVPAQYPTTYIPRPSWPNPGQTFTGFELLLQRIKRTLK